MENNDFTSLTYRSGATQPLASRNKFFWQQIRTIWFRYWCYTSQEGWPLKWVFQIKRRNVLTVALLRPRSFGSFSTSCKYHFKGLSGWPPDEARKPMAISSDDITSQISDKEDRRSLIIWLSTTREIGSFKETLGVSALHLDHTNTNNNIITMR